MLQHVLWFGAFCFLSAVWSEVDNNLQIFFFFWETASCFFRFLVKNEPAQYNHIAKTNNSSKKLNKQFLTLQKAVWPAVILTTLILAALNVNLNKWCIIWGGKKSLKMNICWFTVANIFTVLVSMHHIGKKACKNETHPFIMGHFNTVEQHAQYICCFGYTSVCFSSIWPPKKSGFILSFISGFSLEQNKREWISNWLCIYPCWSYFAWKKKN